MARSLSSALLAAAQRVLRGATGRGRTSARRPTATPGSAGVARTYRGGVRFAYAPAQDGDPDPGEVVWTWVPYEEDATQGKDRPVVVMGWADDGDLVALMLSSRDHRGDRGWVYLGPGAWDNRGRPSSVRVDRMLAVGARAVRREGAALDRKRYDLVATALRDRLR